MLFIPYITRNCASLFGSDLTSVSLAVPAGALAVGPLLRLLWGGRHHLLPIDVPEPNRGLLSRWSGSKALRTAMAPGTSRGHREGTHTRTQTHTHTRTHAHARAHTHTHTHVYLMVTLHCFLGVTAQFERFCLFQLKFRIWRKQNSSMNHLFLQEESPLQSPSGVCEGELKSQ